MVGYYDSSYAESFRELEQGDTGILMRLAL